MYKVVLTPTDVTAVGNTKDGGFKGHVHVLRENCPLKCEQTTKATFVYNSIHGIMKTLAFAM